MRFQWNKKCEEAFRDFKAYLAQLLILSNPIPPRETIMGVPSYFEGVSFVLVLQEEIEQ